MTKIKKKVVPLTEIQRKRVVVLKDAIAQIKAKVYTPKSGYGFVELNNSNDVLILADAAEVLEPKSSNKIELKKYLNKLVNKTKPCKVCAKGAMLISCVAKFNNLSLAQAAELGQDTLNEIASDKMQSFFGVKNANRIEAFFEDGTDWEVDEVDWRDKYPNDADRLIAIFENAIKNKGIFKP